VKGDSAEEKAPERRQLTVMDGLVRREITVPIPSDDGSKLRELPAYVVADLYYR